MISNRTIRNSAAMPPHRSYSRSSHGRSIRPMARAALIMSGRGRAGRRRAPALRSHRLVGADDLLAGFAGCVQPLVGHGLADLLEVGAQLIARRLDAHAVRGQLLLIPVV